MPAHGLRAPHRRTEVAEALAGGQAAQDLLRPEEAEVLRARHVPLPVGRGPARGPLRGLHRHGHPHAVEADAGLRTCSTRWAGTPSACPPRTTPSRRASTRASPPSAPSPTSGGRSTRGLRVRLGPRGQHHRSRVLQVDAVDLPAALQEGPRLRGRDADQLVPLVQDGPRQRGGLGGKCERCGTQVERKDLRQWMLRITAYADRLLEDLDEVDWPESTLACSATGSAAAKAPRSSFRVAEGPAATPSSACSPRGPDTLYGATYMVLAPEHALVDAAHHARAAAGGGGLPGGGPAQERPGAHRARQGEDGRLHGRLRAQPRERRSGSHLDRGLRAGHLRHGRHHGRARARRARLRVRGEVRAAHPAGGPPGGRRGRARQGVHRGRRGGELGRAGRAADGRGQAEDHREAGGARGSGRRR